MNWKTLLLYASFGLFVGILSLFTDTSSYELLLWLFHSFFVLRTIQRKIHQYKFLHALLFGLITGTLLGSVQALGVDSYLTNNPNYAEAFTSSPISPALLLFSTGILFGVIYGIVLIILTLVFKPKVAR